MLMVGKNRKAEALAEVFTNLKQIYAVLAAL